MTQDQFDALVDRIERRLGSRPLLALRMRIAALVVLGYAVFMVWFLPTLLIGAIVLLGAAADSNLAPVMIAAGSLLVVLGGIQAVGRSWETSDPQSERVVRLKEAPRLFELTARLCASLKSKRFHKIRITPDFNAGVEFIPRLGVFGWPRRVLNLGLPLLETLSPGEFEAVLAHELAHLSRQHGRFGPWVYRLRRMWQQTFEEFHEPARSRFGRVTRSLLVKFVDWYWPRFNACALVLSRANEYAADRSSVDWAGTPTTAFALWRIACHSQRLRDEFLPALWKLAGPNPDPPEDMTSRLAAVFAQPPAADDACRWTAQATSRLTDNVDTHPSLCDRFRAMGHSLEACRSGGFPGVARPSAAAALLGDSLETLRRDVDLLWQRQVKQAWRGRHGLTISLQHKLTALENAARNADSDLELLWDKARGTLDLEGPAAAEPVFRRLLSLNPEHSAANLILGRILLDQGRAEGEQFLRRVLEKEGDALIPDACNALSQYFLSAGRVECVQEVHQRLSRFQAALAAADRERNVVTASDRFLPHGLAADELAALQDVLSGEPDLAAAYLVRKELKHLLRQPLFVLCVRSSAGLWSLHRGDRDTFLAAQLVRQVRLPGRALVIAPRGPFRALGRVVMAAAGAQVYPVRSPVSEFRSK